MTELSYTEKGSGFPLILLHGNGEDRSYFCHQMEPFAECFRVIALDTRGHGQSPRGEGEFSISRFAEDLKEFMDALEIPKAHILGFSDGGNIALTFALRYPQRVGKLVLNGANFHPRGVKPMVQIPIVLGYGIASLFARISPEAKKHAELLRLMVKEPNIRPEELSSLPMSTLVIAGERDMIKTRHTQEIAASILKGELCILPGDHFVANKNPAAFNAEVLDFLLWDF